MRRCTFDSFEQMFDHLPVEATSTPASTGITPSHTTDVSTAAPGAEGVEEQGSRTTHQQGSNRHEALGKEQDMRRYDDPVEVRRGMVGEPGRQVEAPEQFLWRGTL